MQRVLFIQDSVAADNTDQKGNVSLLRPPRGNEQVVQDEQSCNEQQLPLLETGLHARVRPSHAHLCLTTFVSTSAPAFA